ncbi:MAG: pyrroloquinoline quinone biosynthesis protein PqqE [Methanoregula sp. PtaU1.Bin051]|nr:MAG: pyrroloquinoline quinone biosynthesis protein PqqE [Methanoregula sp. PtaU1.Bin051]
MIKSRSIIKKEVASTCFFRSSVVSPYRKAVIRITDVCNAHCVHCFISAENHGESMSFENFRDFVLPRIKQCRVSNVTLTGGEPFLHPDILDIVQLLTRENIRTGICTNANIITDDQIQTLSTNKNVHINASLHGFSPDSHDRFMAKKGAFKKCISTIRQLSKYNLIQGILVTPNNFADVREYEKLCEFAIQVNAKYVLMNPLSSMGRGVDNVSRFAVSRETLELIRKITQKYSDRIQLAYIRFPNDSLPLGDCEAGNIFYVFVNGDVTICAYLDFAAHTPVSQYNPKEFMVGNIFQDADIPRRLDSFKFQERYKFGINGLCKNCNKNSICGKGCPSAVIYAGKKIGDIDSEVCSKIIHEEPT